ncbi:protein Daple-like isoform X2 [Anomaloglossus baeobatrachus]|uniref:protein Daple-like isoform X2 n=1 Tax=Anomaloglossus baeobatrachus TaxID=238106 RepID=UPI003F509D0D
MHLCVSIRRRALRQGSSCTVCLCSLDRVLFGSSVLVDVGHKQNRKSYHGCSSEEMEGSERTSRSRRMEAGTRAFSTSAIHLSPATSLRSQQPGRSKGNNSDENLFEQCPENERSSGGHRVPRPHSTTSTGSSPLTLKGSASFPPGRPDSTSSDDFVPTREAATFHREGLTAHTSSTLLSSGHKPDPASAPNIVLSGTNPERRPPSRTQPRPPSGSPSSEMVTLEEFLEESNQTSPHTEASSGRDDMMADYFKKMGDSSELGSPVVQAGYTDYQYSAPNYVNLLAKLPGDAKPGRPGQYVKPNLRPTDPATNQTASLRRTPVPQPVATSQQVPEPQHPGSLAGKGSSLSRVFSLATADLLKANGPDLTRMEKPELETPVLQDFSSQILRTSTPTGSPSDRPNTGRMFNPAKNEDLRTRSLDTRRLSLAVSREDKTLQHALSSSSLQQPYASTQTAGRGRSRPSSRYGEVAMVSPVRPISSIPEVEAQTGTVHPKPPNLSDCHPPVTAEDDPNKTSPKSTPASPDSTTDPQTVWYEYGCV